MTEPSNLQSLASSIQAVASPFRNYLNALYDKYQQLHDGAVADYIPELALANPDWFGICVITKEGQVFEVGECEELFTIQSISKANPYIKALDIDCIVNNSSHSPTSKT